ncbi:MAG TPA: GNAT family protein [Oxalicibacterium sp.]|uniref:GNAT family N-acetyltransferase n=1 Tax=Oxalicibacterium sp. TaxID=2766525 RepID=UPI002C3B0691|nr:GNAT family protein [Oxalicibacterium sp.]HWU99062.1 GNAT family protein [Oxalicibacterium sp.]
MHFLDQVTLVGKRVTLEPLTEAHHDALVSAAADGELWKLWYTTVASPDDMRAYIATALDLRQKQSALPFVIRDNRTGHIVGSTRYMNVDGLNRRVEIGSTWHAASAQRTGINREAKLLLLTHAFETLYCIAVEFRTHWLNHQSRNAIAALGAKQDGVLRNHQRLADGSFRDTVVFSIIESEWPAVKNHLRHGLER